MRHRKLFLSCGFILERKNRKCKDDHIYGIRLLAARQSPIQHRTFVANALVVTPEGVGHSIRVLFPESINKAFARKVLLK